MTMALGQYRGWAIEGVPNNCLIWLGSIDITRKLRAAVEAKIRCRSYRDNQSYRHANHRRAEDSLTRRGPRQDIDLIAEIIESDYRVTAQKHHPGIGGNELRYQLGVAA
jgi:hypothetical protein